MSRFIIPAEDGVHSRERDWFVMPEKRFFDFNARERTIRIGSWHVSLPRSRALRIFLAVALMFGGVLGFLPVLGFWMLPLGILILSLEFHAIRRLRRRTIVWWRRRKLR